MLPSDSIVIVPEEVYEKAYENGMSTSPSLYSIERRKNDTKVTFIQPIYWDWQWLYYSPGFKIIDKKSGDEYNVRGYDGGAHILSTAVHLFLLVHFSPALPLWTSLYGVAALTTALSHA